MRSVHSGAVFLHRVVRYPAVFAWENLKGSHIFLKASVTQLLSCLGQVVLKKRKFKSSNGFLKRVNSTTTNNVTEMVPCIFSFN